MSLDLGELVGTLRLDTAPFNTSATVAEQRAAVLAKNTKDSVDGIKGDIKVKVNVVTDVDKAKEKIAEFKTEAAQSFKHVGISISGILTTAGAAGPIVLAMGAALSSAAAGGVALASAVGPAAAGGLMVYAGGLLAVKSASTLVTFAMAGVMDAAAGDKDAMAALSPEAKVLAREFAALKPEIEKIRTSAQAGLFPGVAEATSMLAKDYLPLVDAAAEKTGGVLGDLAVDAAKVADSPTFKSSFGTIVDGNAKTLDSMGHAGISLADAAVTLFASAQPLINTFFKWAAGAASTIDKTVQAANESGKLADFWDRAANRGESLWHILSNLGSALGDVFSIGADDAHGGKLLNTVERVTEELKEWTSSESGAAKIAGWFDQGRANLGAMADLIATVSGGLAGIGSGAQLAPLIDQITKEVIPPLMEFLGNASASGALSSLVSAVGSVIAVFASLSENDRSLYAFADTLNMLASAAEFVVQHVPGAGTALGAFFTVLGTAGALKLVGLGPALGMVTSGLGLLTTKLLIAAGAQTTETGAVTLGTVARSIQSSTLMTWIGVKYLEMTAWIRSGAAAVVSGAQTAAAWLLAGASAEAGLVPTIIAFGATIAGWVASAAAALAGAASVALAWLIAIAPIAIVIAAIVAVGYIIYKNWDNIKKWTGEAWDWVVDKVKAVPGLLVAYFLNFTLPGLIIKHWDTIKAGTEAAWNAVVDFVKAIPGKLLSFFLNYTLPGLVISHFEQLKEGAIDKAQQLISWVAGLPGKIIDKVAGLGALLAEKGRDAFIRMRAGAEIKAAELIIWAALLPGKIVDKIGNLGNLLKDKGKDLLGGLKDGAIEKFVDVALWFGNVGDKAKAKIGDLTDTLKQAGRDLMAGLLAGIVEAWEAVKSKIESLAGWIKDHKGPRSKDLELLRPAGHWIMEGLLNGLEDKTPDLHSKVKSISELLSDIEFTHVHSPTQATAPFPTSFYATTAHHDKKHHPTGKGDIWNIYETDSPQATAAEVSRRQAFAGAAG